MKAYSNATLIINFTKPTQFICLKKNYVTIKKTILIKNNLYQ